MRLLKIYSDVDKELSHLCAGEGVAVVRVHVAADGVGQGAPYLDVLDVVFVELLYI